MMNLENLSAFELGELVNKKAISPTEVLDYFEDRITRRNPTINAFTYLNFEDARDEAKKLESLIMKGEDVGPFAGVPIALKDFLPTKKGWPATHGGVPSYQTIDEANSPFYEAARQLGAIAVGKTNAPAFGFRGTTDNVMFGPTSTPFNVKYNSGGSSGGSAAAVSDGLVYLAEFGDAGGSGRIPAAWCGCFGFKPSAGLVPSVCRPDAWTATHPYCCGGPGSRTIKDAALIVETMQKYDPRDPISVPLIKKNLVWRPSIKGMKIAVTYDFGIFPDPDFEIEKAITRVANMLKDAGADVQYIHPRMSVSREDCENAWLRGMSVDTGIELTLYKWENDKDRVDPSEVPYAFNYWCNEAFRSTMLDYRTFHEVRTAILDAHQDIFDKFDIILAPVSGCLPVLNADDHDTKGPSVIGGQPVDPLIGFAYTYLENMIGTPAASIPIGLSSDLNLPIGMQIIGRRYFDEDVFTVAYALEEINPWNYDIPFNREVG